VPTTYHDERSLDREALQAFRKEVAGRPPFVVAAESRPLFDASMQTVPPAIGVDYIRDTMQGIDGWRCLPKNAAADTAFLYLHGGVYVVGSAAAFRPLVGQLAVRAGGRAFIPDYGRAPRFGMAVGCGSDGVSHALRLRADWRAAVTNEEIIRNAYRAAEVKDIAGWINAFTDDGTFTDQSVGITYRGKELGDTVEVYAKAFPDMHRELYRFFTVGDTVIVELALQGTHKGPLALPMGTIPPTGKRMDAPCCDVFRLKSGKIASFNCYPSGTVIMSQLGVLGNLQAAVSK
jgi:ketosteroid isomerase-like protein